METISNVTFLYTNIQVPKKRYQSEETEWSVQCCISKEQAKTWNKRFRKQQAKTFENEEFVEKFGIDAPFPNQDEQYTIKLSRATHFKDGKAVEPKYAPKVFQAIGGGKVKNITKDKLISNGSTGKAAYDVVENDFGTFAKLNSICVEKLIEYIPQGGNPFGDEVEDEEEASQQAAFEKPENKPAAKPSKPAKPKAPVEDDEGISYEDCPF